MESIFIVLEDGHVFEGKAFGATGTSIGELVFTTGMCGYIETLTDPSYYGQIVMQTFPLIGNYGMINADKESKNSCIKGYVVREWCEKPSNFRCEYDLDKYLKDEGIIGVYGVDTREITQIIREHGVMNAQIVSNPDNADFDKIKSYKVENAVKSVSTDKTEVFEADGEEKFSVVLIDYGAKLNIIRELNMRGCKVTVVPHTITAEEILAMNPDGLMLSNGPGDPQENVFEVGELKKLRGKIPTFGICLGHQLFALANGGTTVKLKYGHRGVNQPVKQLATGRTFISSQNHGYAVVSESVEANGGKVSYINANDGTCEGIDYPEINAFTVQFHPEACSGPRDTRHLFDRFIDLMGGNE